jgi:hypothetical protein
VARDRGRPALLRRVGSVYAQIGRVYRDSWASILLLALVVFIPLGLIDAAAGQFDPGSVESGDGLKILVLLTALGAVTTTGLLGEVFFAGAVAISLTHPEHERPPPLRHIARQLKYGRLIVVDILYVIVVAIGLILFLAPGIAAFVLLGLAGPAVELEDRGVRGALARSFRLVRSDFWLVFLVLVPVEIVGDLVGEGLEHLAHSAFGDTFFSTWLSEAASNTLLSPVFAVAAVVLTTRLIASLDGSGPRIRSLRARRTGDLEAVA